MAGNKRSKANKSKGKSRPRRAKPNRRRAGNRPTRSLGLGSSIAHGVRNLIASIPGVSAFTPIADYALKAFGFSNLKCSDGVYEGDADIGALVSRLCISYVNILTSSREVMRISDGKGRIAISTPWLEARLLELTITVSPTNPVSKRSGVWSIGFKPFYDENDHKKEMDKTDPPGRIGMLGYPLYTTGPASSKLSLTYRPRVPDGYAYHFHSLDDRFGCFVVRYESYSRDAFGAFTAEQVGFECLLSGKLEMRNRVAQDDNSTGFEYLDNFAQPVKDVEIYIQDTSGEVHTIMKDLSTVSYDKDKVRCTFVKDISDYPKLLDLKSMELGEES